ncbi:amidohydrolase [Kitasatospora sp. NBC_01302]|nr:amidohydrolase [Kitasatospora sp. NBC_01302]
MDELHADGVVLMSNAQGRYLGDPAFEPLWAELDARAAVVFIHPTESALPMLPGIPAPVIDFTFDTARAAVQMTFNGVMSRHTRMKVILSHAGGFLPYAAHRVARPAGLRRPRPHPLRQRLALRHDPRRLLLHHPPGQLPGLAARPTPRRQPRQRRSPLPPPRPRMTPGTTRDARSTATDRSVDSRRAHLDVPGRAGSAGPTPRTAPSGTDVHTCRTISGT